MFLTVTCNCFCNPPLKDHFTVAQRECLFLFVTACIIKGTTLPLTLHFPQPHKVWFPTHNRSCTCGSPKEVLLATKRRVAVGTVYSNATFSFLPVNHAAFPYREQSDYSTFYGTEDTDQARVPHTTPHKYLKNFTDNSIFHLIIDISLYF